MDDVEHANPDVTAPRPLTNPHWVCGNARLGTPCLAGPNARGKCPRAQAALQQQERQNATDSPSDASSDPNCASETDAPCIPVRSAWYFRQNLALNAAILVAGLLLLVMTIPQREQIFKPGQLSTKHAQILGNHLVSDRCSLCHPNSHPDSGQHLLQDDLCLACHQQHMPDATLRSPHDVSREQLALMMGNVGQQDQSATRGFPHSLRLVSAPKATACATCHVEHKGPGFDLKSMTDRRCQACHQRQFEGFANGHPQFDGYPYRTQRRIAFDHGAHEASYFPQKNQDFQCASCHVDRKREGGVGNVFRSLGFDQACASCHEEPIRASATNGWAVLQVPCLPDLEADELGVAWPSAAKFDFDGEVSLAFRLLLLADEQCRTVLSYLPASGKIAEIETEHKSRVAKQIARGFAAILQDVAAQGQVALQQRLADVVRWRWQREPSQQERALINEMVYGLPPDLFRDIQQRWFSTEANLAANDHSVPVQLAAQTLLDAPLDGSQGNDLLEPNVLDEQADDQAVNDGELLNAFGTDGEEGLEEFGVDETLPVETKNWPPINGYPHLQSGGWYLDNTLLAIRYVPRGHEDRVLAAWAEFANLVSNVDEESSSPSHGEQLLSLRYGELVPGGCTECHLLGTDTADDMWSNWKSETHPDTIKRFTKFNHTPHLNLPAVRDCTYCHRQATGPAVEASRSPSLEPQAETLKQLIEQHMMQSDVRTSKWISTTRATVENFLHHEFLPMETEQCSACHRQNAAGDGCTQCHNYHVGQDGFRLSQPRLDGTH